MNNSEPPSVQHWTHPVWEKIDKSEMEMGVQVQTAIISAQ